MCGLCVARGCIERLKGMSCEWGKCGWSRVPDNSRGDHPRVPEGLSEQWMIEIKERAPERGCGRKERSTRSESLSNMCNIELLVLHNKFPNWDITCMGVKSKPTSGRCDRSVTTYLMCRRWAGQSDSRYPDSRKIENWDFQRVGIRSAGHRSASWYNLEFTFRTEKRQLPRASCRVALFKLQKIPCW